MFAWLRSIFERPRVTTVQCGVRCSHCDDWTGPDVEGAENVYNATGANEDGNWMITEDRPRFSDALPRQVCPNCGRAQSDVGSGSTFCSAAFHVFATPDLEACHAWLREHEEQCPQIDAHIESCFEECWIAAQRHARSSRHD